MGGRTSTFLAAALIATANGCSPDTGGTSTVRDSAGVTIVESLAAPAHVALPWQLDTLARVQIGSLEGSPADELHGVVGATVLSNGTVVVANGGTNEIRAYGMDGRHVRTIGRRGEGPEEFSRMYGLFTCSDDRIVVNEGRKLSILDGDLRFVRTVPVPSAAEGPQNAEGISHDCSKVLLLGGSRMPDPATAGVYAQTYALRWSALSGGDQSAVIEFPGPELTTVSFGGAAMTQRLPWGKSPVWTTGADRVVIGLSGSPEVREYTAALALDRIVRWFAEPRPIADSDRALFEANRERTIREDARAALYAPPLHAFAHLPNHQPVYSQMLLDDSGNLWVRDYPERAGGRPLGDRPNSSDPPSEWSLFDAEGVFIGRISVPSGVRVLGVRAGHVIGLWRDSNDVEYVRLYALVPA